MAARYRKVYKPQKGLVRKMEDIMARYRGNYIREMRKEVGHAPLMVTSCGVIIENENGEILLQKRRDNGCFGLPGGAVEIGEKLMEAAAREVYEEVGVVVEELRLFAIYSGEDRIIIYPNGDICYVTNIIFLASGYRGEIKHQTEEAVEHRFFGKANLPENINEFDRRCILDWAKEPLQVIVD